MLRSFPSNVKKFSEYFKKLCYDLLRIMVKLGCFMGTKLPRTVKKSNSLVRSSYQMSLSEIRLMTLLFAHLRSGVIEYVIYTSDYAAAFGVEYHSAIESMIDAASQLQTRVFVTPADGNPDKMQSISWVQTCTYYRDQSKVGIKLGEDMLPFLFDLKKHFTSYPLIDASGLTSYYAFRFFEIARSYLSLGVFEISLVDLREILKLDSEYRQGDVQTKILKPALVQINERTPLLLEYQPVKQGRDVVGYLFKVAEKPKLSKPKKVENRAELHSKPPAFKLH